MAFNGSGVHNRVHDWTQDLANTIPVTASRMDAEHDDVSAALSNTICRDGQSTTTARIPFASGVSAAAGSTSSVSYAQTNDTNTGLYFPASDQWGLAADGTATLTSTAAKLTAAVAADFTGAVAPTSDDGAALGSTSQKWSDLFLAAGGVINFNSGDVTVTHSSNALAFSGGAVSFDSSVSVSSGGITVSARGASITGNSSVTGTLAVSQAATFSSSIQATSASFSGNVTSSGAVSGATAAGDMIAAEAHQESGTATNLVVTPGRQHFHKSAAKAWGKATPFGSLLVGYNVSSVTDVDTGKVDFNYASAFSGAYAAVATCEQGLNDSRPTTIQTSSAASVRVGCVTTGTTFSDPSFYYFVAFGDL